MFSWDSCNNKCARCGIELDGEFGEKQNEQNKWAENQRETPEKFQYFFEHNE
jgi:hypothetical protein